MPNFKATLTSVGDVNNAYIYLEILPSLQNLLPIPIFLSPKGTNRKVWSNSNISVDVSGLLDYDFRVHAFKGTGWVFKLVNQDNKKEILSIEGQTGEDPKIGNNISVKRGQVSLDGSIVNEIAV